MKINFTNSSTKNEWLSCFYELIKNNGFSDQEISILFTKINESYSMRQNIHLDNNITISNTDKEKEIFSYLKTIKEKLTYEYIKEGVDIATNVSKELDFIDSFIRYIVLTNLPDINVHVGLSPNNQFKTTSRCVLAEYKLAELELYIGRDSIMFGGVEVNKNVRRLGIGTRLFTDVISNIYELYPTYQFIAYTVDKNNNSAIEFYKSLGAEIGDSYIDDCYSVTFKPSKIEKIYKKE